MTHRISRQMMLMAHRRTATRLFRRDFDRLTGVETIRVKADRPTFWSEFEALASRRPITVRRGALFGYPPAAVAHRMAAVSQDIRPAGRAGLDRRHRPTTGTGGRASSA